LFRSCFSTNTTIRTVEYAIGNHNILPASRHFTSNDDTAMPTYHRTIGYRIILRRNIDFTAGAVFSGFDRDAIIAYRDMAIGNMHITTRFGINTIGIGRRRIVNRDAIHGEIIAILRIDRPERRVLYFNIFYLYILATQKLNKWRT